MQNLKIKVNNEAESREVQELFLKLGYKDRKNWTKRNPAHESIQAWKDGEFTFSSNHNNVPVWFEDITIAELRNMVKPMQEYLNTETYEYKLAHTKPDGEWVQIPSGADFYVESKIIEDSLFFCMDNSGVIETYDTMLKNSWHREKLTTQNLSKNYEILWQRPQQPEALPFIDDNPQSLNDQYAEIEQVRQDMINSPTHYTKGNVECIDAIESATVGKTGIDAVCVANVIKYLWCYEEKNGVEDIKKAEWYLQKLIENNI